jgi:4-amino-4-deoxy-L-arabinose transferase-like glycosyltransferase
MAVTLLLLALATTMIGRIAAPSSASLWTRWRIALLHATVLAGVAIALSTEALSLLGQFSYLPLLLVWALLLLASLGYALWQIRRAGWPGLPARADLAASQQAILGALLLILALVGLTAALAPTNNWDSQTYHMARIPHWIENRSVDHFPTHFLPQLYQAPWAEYAIAQTMILSGGDRLANLVQWYGMLASAVIASLIARQLGARRSAQLLAALFVATLPMVIMQASSTQNDLLQGLWMLVLMYATLELRNQMSWQALLLAGAGLGLAVLTKATSYVLIPPVVIFFGVIAIRQLGWGIWKAILGTGGVALLIVASMMVRHTLLFGNPVGLAPNEGQTTNAIFGPHVTLSNVMRNASLHVITPDKWVNAAIRVGIRVAHIPLLIAMDDPRTTFGEGDFRQPPFSTHEDTTGNAIFFGLLVGAIILLQQWPHRPPILVWYAITVLASFLLFCTLLRWQPWASRLHTGLFLLWAPWVAVMLTRRMPRLVGMLVPLLITVGCLPWVLFNESRPLLSLGARPTVFSGSQLDLTFIRRQNEQAPYTAAAEAASADQCTTIGLVVNSRNFWEYAIWKLLRERSSADLRVVHVNVTNISASQYAQFPAPTPCAIIGVDLPESTITVGESTYRETWAGSNLKVLR